MKSFDTELKKYAEKINLKASERRELRERILSYMEYHPLPKQTRATEKLVMGIPSDAFVKFNFNSFHARIAGGIFVLILILAPFAAERSVPGDVLYLVKTGFNETIQGQLVNSPYEKIEFETKLMERRIGEARTLASEGKLTEDVKTQIAETVKEHTTAVRAGLTELRTQDADGAAIAEIAFNSSLEVQTAVLNTNESTNSTSSIDSILTVVNEAREEVVQNHENSKPSFDGLMARVELETTRAYELFEVIKVSATEEEIRDIERRLSDINRLILEAKEKNTREEEIAAHDLATTLGLTQKLVSFMTNIDVRETVTLESIVPVVLSEVERVDLVKESLRTSGEMKIEVTQRLEFIEDSGMQEKVQEGLTRAEELFLKTSTALEANDIDVAESFMNEAKVLLNDLNTMTQSEDGGPEKADDVPEEVDPTIPSDEDASTTPNVSSEEHVDHSPRG